MRTVVLLRSLKELLELNSELAKDNENLGGELYKQGRIQAGEPQKRQLSVSLPTSEVYAPWKQVSQRPYYPYESPFCDDARSDLCTWWHR